MQHRLNRREVITLLGGAAAWPLAGHAQQAVRLPAVGFLGASSPTTAGVWVSAFTSRLREVGWIEDRNIKIDLRWAEGRNDRSAEIAAEFIKLRVDVIVTYSSEHTQIAKQATSTIPIVFALAADPVGSGLVANLARPGGNVTGLSAQNVDLTGKRFRVAARDRSESASTGGPVQRQQADRHGRDRHRSDRRQPPWYRGISVGDFGCRGYCPRHREDREAG